MKSNFFLFIYAKTTRFLFLLLSIFRLWYWWHCVVKSRTFTTRPPWTMTLHVLWTQLGWHALEIDMKIFPTHANYKTQLDFTPNWHPQVSCSKGSGKEAGYEGPPHVGEEWTICGGPHHPPRLLSPFRKHSMSQWAFDPWKYILFYSILEVKCSTDEVLSAW